MLMVAPMVLMVDSVAVVAAAVVDFYSISTWIYLTPSLWAVEDLVSLVVAAVLSVVVVELQQHLPHLLHPLCAFSHAFGTAQAVWIVHALHRGIYRKIKEKHSLDIHLSDCKIFKSESDNQNSTLHSLVEDLHSTSAMLLLLSLGTIKLIRCIHCV